MDSLLQQAVANIRLKNYMSFVVMTAIGYDYILVLSDEIEFIWNKPWTWSSTLFVLARYSGLCSAVFYGLWGSSFLPGSAETYVVFTLNHSRLHIYQQIIIGIGGGCCFLIFVCSADLVMALRLWTLYNRSRLIFSLLFVFYATEAISVFVFYVLTFTRNRHYPSVGAAQVLELSFCVWKYISGPWSLVLYVFKIIFSAFIWLLIAVKSGEELLLTYRTTTRFQPNRYRKRLAWEGTIYFTAILVFSILGLLVFAGIQPTGEGRTIMTVVLQLQMPPIALIPRFILSLRKLYLRDGHGRITSGIDTALGLTSGGGMSMIVFGDVGSRNDSDDERGGGIQVTIKA